MRILPGLFFALVLAFSAPFAHQQPQSSACGFTVQSSASKPEITGPSEMVPLVYVVDQPDSPIEIRSINLDGSWLAVSGDRYTERTCVHYEVRNRRDRTVQQARVVLAYNGQGGAGTGDSGAMAAGQTAELVACGIGGTGGAHPNPMKILISIAYVTTDDCAFRPSARVPLSLGVRPSWDW